MKQHLKLAKYLQGTGTALKVLAAEIRVRGKFDKEDKDLLAKIGANLTFHALSYNYLV